MIQHCIEQLVIENAVHNNVYLQKIKKIHVVFLLRRSEKNCKNNGLIDWKLHDF